jgi:hypothetical protein
MLHWLYKRTWTRWPQGAWHCWYWVPDRALWWEMILWPNCSPFPDGTQTQG